MRQLPASDDISMEGEEIAGICYQAGEDKFRRLSVCSSDECANYQMHSNTIHVKLSIKTLCPVINICTGRMIKPTVVITETYHCCQLCITFYLTSFSQFWTVTIIKKTTHFIFLSGLIPNVLSAKPVWIST
jgi:hypothetical protein